MGNVKMILAATFVLGASLAFADKLSDFQDAVTAAKAGKGCESIPASTSPYSDYRKSCDSEGPQVHEWCDGKKGPIDCGDAQMTRQAQADVEKAQKVVETLKDEKRTLGSALANAETDDEKKKIAEDLAQVAKDLDEAEARLAPAIAALEARTKLVEEAIITLDKCIAYRRAVMNSFAAALDKVRTENETPEIEALAEVLRDHYEASKSGHEDQITNKTRSLETCKSSRPR